MEGKKNENRTDFGARLKLARKREGLSLRDLAACLKGEAAVSAQAIGKYERGEMEPSSAVVSALSKALRVSVGYLLSPSDPTLTGVEFRKLASTKARERATVEMAVLDGLSRYLEVEEALGFANPQWDKPEKAPYPVASMEKAEQAAEKVRQAWNLGGDPIQDMTELLEEKGIKVLKLDFPLSVDGLTCNALRPNRKAVPAIVCATHKSIERQRFTLAHELGHMMLKVADNVDEEKACHRFAGAFLAPREALLAEVGRRRDRFGYAELIEIKHMFGVSAAALVYRLCDIGVITEATRNATFRGVGRKWRKEEPAPLARAEPARRFHRLCFRALAEDCITASKAAELLGVPISRIDGIMSGPEEAEGGVWPKT